METNVFHDMRNIKFYILYNMHYNILIYLYSFISSLFLDDSSADSYIDYQSDISSCVTGNLNVFQNQDIKYLSFSPQVTSSRLHLFSFTF